MNSGSVSLADAIAKAREKGTPFDLANLLSNHSLYMNLAQSREDPRSASRAYRRSRSRSRSPPRRDNFRDNYNPYRDERRDDRGRASNGRDRSFSPQRHGAYSPPAGNRASGFDGGRVRSPPANAETNSEVITVASSDVGLIIGRAGENLRRVEAETGARVQFLSGPENSGPLRQCRISGTPRQREDAKADIFRVAQENPNGARQGSVPSGRPGVEPPLDDKSLQIMVPDKTVGLIIGRGGETIRDLQDRSGCHVNITAENKSVNGLRPVNLIGSYESQMKAKEMIMEVVQSDTRAEGDKGPPQRGSYETRGGAGYDTYSAQAPAAAPAPYGADPYGSAANGKINDNIQVPSEAVGMIIGKGGETIKDMQNQSSCKINVSPPSGADVQRDIGLIGTRQAIESAKRLIWEKVDAVVCQKPATEAIVQRTNGSTSAQSKVEELAQTINARRTAVVEILTHSDSQHRTDNRPMEVNQQLTVRQPRLLHPRLRIRTQPMAVTRPTWPCGMPQQQHRAKAAPLPLPSRLEDLICSWTGLICTCTSMVIF